MDTSHAHTPDFSRAPSSDTSDSPSSRPPVRKWLEKIFLPFPKSLSTLGSVLYGRGPIELRLSAIREPGVLRCRTLVGEVGKLATLDWSLPESSSAPFCALPSANEVTIFDGVVAGDSPEASLFLLLGGSRRGSFGISLR